MPNIRIDKDTYERLRTMAYVERRSLKDLARDAVIEYVCITHPSLIESACMPDILGGPDDDKDDGED